MKSSTSDRSLTADVRSFPQQFVGRTQAALLDRLADAELQHGHHGAAERLAWRAAELRNALPSSFEEAA